MAVPSRSYFRSIGIGFVMLLTMPLTSALPTAALGESGSSQALVGRVMRTTPSMVARGEVRGVTSATDTWSGIRLKDTRGDSGGGVLAVPPTPPHTYAFSSGTTSGTRVDVGGSSADSNLAASRTHICITTRAAFACYTKGGRLVSSGAAFSARPYTAKEFFAVSGIPIGTSFDGKTSAANVAKDGRVVFDDTSRRFFMVFQTREPQGRLMIAVSKSQDPRDGWWTYADLIATSDANTQDYDKIGVNASHLLVSNGMVNCVQQPDGKWSCTAKGTRHLMYTAKSCSAAGRWN